MAVSTSTRLRWVKSQHCGWRLEWRWWALAARRCFLFELEFSMCIRSYVIFGQDLSGLAKRNMCAVSAFIKSSAQDNLYVPVWTVKSAYFLSSLIVTISVFFSYFKVYCWQEHHDVLKVVNAKPVERDHKITRFRPAYEPRSCCHLLEGSSLFFVRSTINPEQEIEQIAAAHDVPGNIVCYKAGQCLRSYVFRRLF
jgi:hypothetical protein